uniref:Uncharacterized protein n=1 Tax=uncultured Thiotrichaceae bacterium TaxID=298394 RepID=A0A6S6S5V6_9GAMM|nr:MAG: Unknown protein [uncultured Thiotrichaceae bacterium]
MRESYDFSNSQPTPYAKRLKKQILSVKFPYKLTLLPTYPKLLKNTELVRT